MTTIEKYEAAVQEYLDRLEWQNLSPRTVENYTRVLRQFGAFLRESGETDLCDAIEAWKVSLMRSTHAPATVNQYLTDLGIFFEKASRRSFPKALRFAENPAADVEPVKVTKRPYAETLTDDQIKALYRNAPYKGARLWERTYAVIMVLLNEKIRNSELCDLRLSDLDFRYHELTVRHGKGDKQRVVDLCALTETAILAYLGSGLCPDYLSDDDFLFGVFDGGKWSKMSRQGLSKLVEHHVASVCGVEGVRSHALRHVGSRLCLNAGTSLEELQGQLGHVQISTTMIYSGRLQQRRRRESAQEVLAARDAAAAENRLRLDALPHQETKRETA